MKTTNDRTPRETSKLGTRSLALLMFFVMLFTAIGSGSLLSAFAVTKDDVTDEAAPAEAVAVEENGYDADLYDTEETMLGVKKDSDLAGTGANVDLADTGYSGCKVKGSWDNWVKHDITSTSYTVSLSANTTYNFVYVAENNDQFSANVTISSTKSSYNFSRNDNDSITLKTSEAGEYTFAFKGFDGGGTSMTVSITFPVASTTTYTVAGAYGESGSSDAGFFGTAWAADATDNDMSTSDNTTYTKTWSNVTLSSDTAVYYKIVKNHSWNNTSYPASGNATKTIPAGTYNITATYNSSTNTVDMTYESISKSTLTVAGGIANAVVTATYGGVTVEEGSSISDIPAGASVTVNVTPVTGYKCTAVTANPSATVSGSGSNWTVTMPASNTTVSATLATVSTKTFYFNNMNTMYSMVFAYATYSNGDELLGTYPGTVMTKLDNSNIWTIEIPEDVQAITFIGDNGYNTGKMTLSDSDTWDVNSGKTKYTAPLNHNDAPTLANGGTWGTYLTRNNIYKVSDGSTMNSSSLFTGISATFYDYYVDGEVTNGWLEGIGNREYSQNNGNNYDWNPFTKLDDALDYYAREREVTTYPLYFGNLNTTNGGTDLIKVKSGTYKDKQYYGWNYAANNSNGLTSKNNAVTGLTGLTLANSNIHTYKSGATNENGAVMAMFDEDFLSGENNQNAALASILRSSSFPMRATTVGASYSTDTIYADFSGATGGVSYWAYFFTGTSTGIWKAMTNVSGNTYSVENPGTYSSVIFTRNKNTSSGWSNVWNQTNDLTLPDGSDNKIIYTITGYNSDKMVGSWTAKSDATTSGGHTYYEFDSTNGKDNAYITSINKTNKTAKIDYYNNTNKVYAAGIGSNSGAGFFPFDYNNYQSHLNNIAHDLGFGVKLEIPFTLGEGGLNEDGTPQTFDFSGDDDLWVFVDGQLVLDLGGAHLKTTGSIDFSNKTVTATNKQAGNNVTRNSNFSIDNSAAAKNTVHTMTIYYMERGMYDSNLKFGFSFHAIPEQLQVDKKVRTYDVNSGFFNVNSTTGSGHYNDKEKEITQFEYTYQEGYGHEDFGISHTGYPTDTDNNTITYTIGSNSTTVNSSQGGTINYNLFNDQIAYFSGQYKDGTSVTLKETIPGDSLYKYDEAFSVVNLAQNEAAISYSGNSTNGYAFTMPSSNSSGLSDIRVRARFTNNMKVSTLSLTKELTNASDADTEFEFTILFKFGDYGYIAYPLNATIDGITTTLGTDGTVKIKAGQTLLIPGIPENAKVQIVETVGSNTSDYMYNGLTLKDSTGAAVAEDETVTNGIKFTMTENNLVATASNSKPNYKYSMTYNYTSYGKTPLTDSLYGTQSFTVSGVFTDTEMNSYLQRDGSTVSFQSNDKMRSFVNSKAPYEDNFMQTLSFAKSTIDNAAWNSGTFSCNLTAVATENQTVNVQFKLPYSVEEGDDLYNPVVSSGKVAKTTAETYDAGNVSLFDYYKKDSKFVKVPLIIYDNSTPYYFQYWKVSKQSNFGMKGNAEYTRCYDYEFNLSIFMNCVIEPIYGTSWNQDAEHGNSNPPTTYDMYSRFDPEAQISDQGITIAFLENSRNQYNNNGCGSRDVQTQAADVVYSDFVLSYNYALGYSKLSERDDVTCGLLIQAVDYMGKSDGVFNYTKDYSTDEGYAGASKNDLIAWINGGAKPNGCAKKEFSSKLLDNKNRIEYFYALNNRRLDTNTGYLLNTMQNRYKVFKAYAYAKDSSGNVTISDPVYFTIYDVAHNGLDDNATNS